MLDSEQGPFIYFEEFYIENSYLILKSKYLIFFKSYIHLEFLK